MMVIIGSKGQLGWELVRQCRAAGRETLALDNPEIDICDPASIRGRLDREEIAIVVNAAAYTAVDRAESEPEAAMAVNRDGPANLAEFCRERSAALVHVSTDYVFDGAKKGAYTEEDPAGAVSTYGRGKQAGEEEVRRRLPRHVIVRTAWLYGVHGANFVKTMLRLGREKETLRVVADQFGCPTSAADLAAAILRICGRIKADGGRFPWGTYHFCGVGRTSWHGLAEALLREAARHEVLAVRAVLPITTAEYPTAAARPANSVLDCTKIEKYLGIRPRPWREALAETIDELYAAQAKEGGADD